MHRTHTDTQASRLAWCEPREALLGFAVFMGFQGGQMSWAESSRTQIQAFSPRAHFCLASYSQKQLLNQCLTVDRLPVISFYVPGEVRVMVI